MWTLPVLRAYWVQPPPLACSRPGAVDLAIANGVTAPAAHSPVAWCHASLGRRFQRWLRGSLAALPEPTTPVSAPDSTPVRAVLAFVAAWGLPGTAESMGTLPGDVADAVVAGAKAEGLLGPLLECVDNGALTLPASAMEAAVHAHEAALWWCLAVEQRLGQVDRWFEEAGGVRYRVLKGPAMAHLDDVDPSLRSFGDLDLLVAASDMDAALQVLADHGGRRVFPPRRAGFDRRFAKGTGQIVFDQVEVDVHRTLADGGLGYRIPSDRLFAEPEPFVVADRTVLALCRKARALHACYHAVATTKTPTLRSVRDLGWYLSAPDLQPDALVAEIGRWRGELVLGETVRLTTTTLGVRLDGWEQWADAVVATRRDQALLDRSRRPSARPFEWSTLREIRWQDRPAYLYAVAVPSREVLDSRGQNHRTRLVSGFRNLVVTRRR